MSNVLYDEGDVLRFFNFLSHNVNNTQLEKIKDVYTGYFMYESGPGTGKPLATFATVHGKVPNLLNLWESAVSALEEKNKYKFGPRSVAVKGKTKTSPGKKLNSVCTPSVHVLVNSTDLRGRKMQNVTGTRVVVVDIDRGIEREEIRAIADKYAPEMIVESSPGKYHVYWRIQQATLDEWEKLQMAFAEELGGDVMMSQYNKSIRVPGFYRLKQGKNDEEVTRILPKIVYYQVPGRARRYVDFTIEFDWIEKAYTDAKKRAARNIRNAKAAAKLLLKDLGSKSGDMVSAEKIRELEREQGRNQTLYTVLTLASRKFTTRFIDETPGTVLSADKINEKIKKITAAYCDHINRSFSSPLDNTEVVEVLAKILKRSESWIESKVESVLEHRRMLLGDDVAPETKRDKKKKKKSSKAKARGLKLVKKEHTGDIPTPSVGGAEAIDTSRISKLRVGYDVVQNDTVLKIPESLSKASEMFADKLLSEVGKQLAHLMSIDIELKNTIGTSQFIIKQFLKFGSCTTYGPCVILRGKSRWGTPVAVPTTMTKEQWVAFISRTVYQLVVQLTHNGDTYHAGGVLKKVPPATVLKKIAEGTWEESLLQLTRYRQAPHIIAFQNGVLNLDSRTFVRDDKTPVMYSHPVHASFRPEITGFIEQYGYRNMYGLIRELGAGTIKFFDDWFPNDPEAIDLLMTWLGYSMTTDISKQKFMFMQGPTGAGKGSVSQVMCGIVGDNNYEGAEYKVLDGGFKASALYDKLIVAIEECRGTTAEHARRFELLKKITGGERIQIEQKYMNPFGDFLVGKFILQTNRIPTYEDDGEAVSQRMVPLGFERAFRKEGTNVMPSTQILNDKVIIEVEQEGGDDGWESAGASHTITIPLPDVLATMGALMWMERRTTPDSFNARGYSRTVELGHNMIDKGMNIVKSVISTYFVHGGDGEEVPVAVLRELIEWYADDDESGAELPKSSRALNDLIEKNIKELWDTEVHRPREGGGRVRKWRGVARNTEAFDKILISLEDDTRWMGTYRELAKWVSDISPIIHEKRNSLVSLI